MTRRQNAYKRPCHGDTTEMDGEGNGFVYPWLRWTDPDGLGICLDCDHLLTDNRTRWCTCPMVQKEYNLQYGPVFRKEGKTLPELVPITVARRICKGLQHSRGAMP